MNGWVSFKLRRQFDWIDANWMTSVTSCISSLGFYNVQYCDKYITLSIRRYVSPFRQFIGFLKLSSINSHDINLSANLVLPCFECYPAHHWKGKVKSK